MYKAYNKLSILDQYALYIYQILRTLDMSKRTVGDFESDRQNNPGLAGLDLFGGNKDNLPDIPDDMDMHDNYQAIDVTKAKLILKKQAKEYVESLCSVYLNEEKMGKAEYIESIRKAESMTLTSLLSQVKYSEHTLDSLMRQLDAGGFTDPATYETIIKLQASAIDITMRVAQYVRTMPEYFQSLEDQITKRNAIDLIQTGTGSVTDNETGQIHATEQYGSEGVFKGTGDVLAMIEEAEKLKEESTEHANKMISERNEGITDAQIIDSVEETADKIEDEIDQRFAEGEKNNDSGY